MRGLGGGMCDFGLLRFLISWEMKGGGSGIPLSGFLFLNFF